ncbi:MAG: alpha/beta hydrolase [Bacteroidetes bacterium]|nr:alpha/beta hydrolase [Bacteroidota bacterium]
MTPITIEAVGSGKPVVLIHGFPLSPAIWDSQRDLSATYKLLLPTLPGMGGSDWEPFTIDSLADSIASALTDMGISRVIMLGHSMGGYIALSFAARHAGMLSGFGLVASHPYADSSEAKSGRLQMIERIRREGSDFVGDVMIQKIFAPQTIASNPALISTARSIMKSARPEAIINSQEAMSARPDRSFLLVKMKIPVGLFFGAKDVSIIQTVQNDISALNSAARLMVLPESGHMPMMEHPNEFNSALQDFLSTIQ